MRLILFWITILFFIELCEGKTLKSVIIIARHGARNPLGEPNYYSPPNPPRSGYYGDLNSLGMRQHYLLGKFIREKYAGFVSDYYNESEIEIRSTDFNRTIVSLESLLLGLYGETEEKLSDSQFADQNNLLPPFPVNVSLDFIKGLGRSAIAFNIPVFNNKNENLYTNETIILPENYCKRLRAIYDKIYESQDYSNIVLAEKSFFDPILKLLNIDPNKFYSQPRQFNYFFDLIYVLNYTGGAPKGITPDMVDHINVIYGETVDYMFFINQEVIPLFSNGMKKEITDIFDNAISNSSSRKLTILLGHDSSLINFFAMVGVVYLGIPPYASTLTFELYQTDESDSPNYQVYIYINNVLISPKNPQNYDEFKKSLLANWIKPADYKSICDNTTV